MNEQQNEGFECPGCDPSFTCFSGGDVCRKKPVQQNETPRTDAEASDGWCGDAVCVSATLARKLERELTALRAENAELKSNALAATKQRCYDVYAYKQEKARADALAKELENWKDCNLYPQSYREAVEQLAVKDAELRFMVSKYNEQIKIHEEELRDTDNKEGDLSAARLATRIVQDTLASALKERDELRAQLEQGNNHIQALINDGVNGYRQLATARTALEGISKYDKGSKFGQGICAYGCDCPDIAQKALAQIAPAGGGDKP